ncbi:SRPBCC family protein [Luteococcus sp. Sow4_B9]|uniref:SRPBCC family protein n=1 Tax=Luteococcus sp. Sow4_B9 TaxID=3438792 RepID=UPI003F963FD1
MMQYSCVVDIHAPRARVIELMTDGDRAAEWMAGLVSYRAVQGERGQPGSVSELHFEGVPGSGEMIEKVEFRDDARYDVVYLLGPVRNLNQNSFTDLPVSDDLPHGGTRWTADHVFHLPPGMLEGLGEQGQAAFRANTQASMEAFKRWCEANA